MERGARGSCGIVVRSKPVPVKTSEEYWVKILWKAEALGGHQGLAELVWKLLLSGGTVGKLHIFHFYKIFEQRTKNSLYSNEMEAMLVETLCRNQALDLAHNHPPEIENFSWKERKNLLWKLLQWGCGRTSYHAAQ